MTETVDLIVSETNLTEWERIVNEVEALPVIEHTEVPESQWNAAWDKWIKDKLM